MKVQVSVIIPVYNTGKYLEQCLKSVAEQTLKNIEIICVYKESNDDTFDILKRFEKQDKRIIIINQITGGLGGARNMGIKAAKGKYIAFLDSDDWIDVNAYLELYNVAEKNSNDIVIFPFYSYDEKAEKVLKKSWGSQLAFDKKLFTGVFNYQEIASEDFISDKAPVVAWNKLYNLKFLKSNNLLFPENIRYEDNPFYYECMIKAKRISLLSKKLLYYRINRADSLQASSYDNKNVLDIVGIMKIINEMLNANDVNSAIKSTFLKYMLNEFHWRYELMDTYREEFVNRIKNSISENEFMEFLKITNYKYKNFNIKNYEAVKKPKISVVVPVYNVEKYIEDCIKSITEQTLKEIEIIFIDDYSLDASIKIVENYAKYDKRIRIFYNSSNLGTGLSRNTGLREAKGEFVSFMDPDDLYASKDTLERMFTCAKENSVLAVCGNIRLVDDDYSYDDLDYETGTYNGYNVVDDGLLTFNEYNVWPSWGFTRFIYNLKLIKEKNIYFPNARNYEDPLFFVNFMINIDKFYGISDNVYLYRQVKKIRKSNSDSILETLLSIENILEIYYEKQLFIHYAYEYKNLINFINNNCLSYIKNRRKQYKEIIMLINEILEKVNHKIIYENCDYNIYKSFKEINKNNLNTRIKNGIKSLFKPFYRVLRRILYNIISEIINNNIGGRIDRTTNEITNLKSNVDELKSDLFNKTEKLEKTNELASNNNELISNNNELISNNNELVSNSNQLILDKISNIEKLNELLNDQTSLFFDYKKEFEVLKMENINNLYFKRKIILLGTSEHSNIGDAAITMGIYEFIRNYLKNMPLIEISTYEFQDNINYLFKIINKEDIILLQGGGNLGNRYLAEENLRRTIIENFPNNKIIILPQTIYFDDSEKGKFELNKSQEIYNRHNDLTIFTRGKISLEMANQYFYNSKHQLMLDSALSLNYNYNFKRKGIIACIRNLNDESGLVKDQYDKIFEIIKIYDTNYDFTDNLSTGDIPKIDRNMVVNNQLKLFAQHRLVITDRLHGLIFALITNTPCIVISSYNYKLNEFVEMMGKNKFVKFVDKNIDQLNEEIKEVLSMDSSNYHNDFSKDFKKIIKIINED